MSPKTPRSFYSENVRNDRAVEGTNDVQGIPGYDFMSNLEMPSRHDFQTWDYILYWEW